MLLYSLDTLVTASCRQRSGVVAGVMKIKGDIRLLLLGGEGSNYEDEKSQFQLDHSDLINLQAGMRTNQP